MKNVFTQRMERNLSEAIDLWDNLIDEHGINRTLGGVVSRERYIEGGKETWEQVKALLPNRDMVLEYAAGAGRVAQFAVKDCKHLILLEQCVSARSEIYKWSDDILEKVRVVPDLNDIGFKFTSIYCVNVINHLSYEELWKFMSDCAAVSDRETEILINTRQNWGLGNDAVANCVNSPWPLYMWSLDQIMKMFLVFGFARVRAKYGPWSYDVFRRNP